MAPPAQRRSDLDVIARDVAKRLGAVELGRKGADGQSRALGEAFCSHWTSVPCYGGERFS